MIKKKKRKNFLYINVVICFENFENVSIILLLNSTSRINLHYNFIVLYLYYNFNNVKQKIYRRKPGRKYVRVNSGCKT